MRSNLNVFGGNQFKLPDQETLLKSFFSMQYLASNWGALTGQLVFPILKNEVKCFGADDCFSLAFVVAPVSMVVSLILFTCGKSIYNHVAPSDNMFVKVCKCVAVRT
jgi:solute carrier family 15 (oligopeptide transporter), member 1